MHNISGFGTEIRILATQSFPIGFSVKNFTDDKDPIKIDNVETSSFRPIIDGSIFIFDKCAPVKVEISVIPASDDDINLKILLQARKSTPSIIPLPDVTSMVITYGNGSMVAFSSGSIVSGPLADSITQNGRTAGNTYTFIFGTFSGFQSFEEGAADVVRSIIG